MIKTNEAGKTVLERHIQTVLLSLITGGILFGASQLLNLTTGMTEVKTKLEGLIAQSQKFVTINEINQLEKMRDEQRNELDKRVSKLESRVENFQRRDSR